MAEKHITFCDMCKIEIKEKLSPWFRYANVEIVTPDISPYSIDFNELYLLAKEAAIGKEKDFGNTVKICVSSKAKRYDLCYKCRKKLVSFIEEGQNG